MNPDEPTTPPNAPGPETNPIPPPEPQPESDAPVPQQIETAPTAAPPASGTELPSAFSLFKPSWEAVKLNLWTILAIWFVPFVIGAALLFGTYGLAGSIDTTGKDNEFIASTGGLVILLLFALLALLLVPAMTFTQVQSAQGQKTSIGQALKAGLQNFWRYWGVMIVAGLLILGGLILLVVPGLFMIKRYFLAPYTVFTEKSGVMATLERSAEAAKGRGIAVWGLIGVSFLISLVGIIPILGWILSTIGSVMYYCAPAIRWEQLRKLSPAAPVEA